MSTLLLHHPSFIGHRTPEGHPERPDRIRVIDRVLEQEKFQPLARDAAQLGTMEQAALAHGEAHVHDMRDAIPSEGMIFLDADTSVSPGSWEAALRAMGFCLFNNAAVAARWAQKTYGAERVAIIDFDVHHGNGTQDIFWTDPSVMYCSTHQMPLYPGTGDWHETGAGNIVNVPLREGDGGPEFREAVDTAIFPRLIDFRPDFVIISAGFDAHVRDPLGGLRLVETDYAWVTAKLMEIADQTANGRLISILEGGYDLEGLSRSVAAHVSTLMTA